MSRAGPGRGHVDVEAVKAALPITDLLARDLTPDPRRSDPRRGELWFACPLHGERTPSLHAEARKGLWRCFGCGAGGDHVTWATDYLGAADFRSALAMLAEIAGVEAGAAPRPAPRATPAEGPDPAAVKRARQARHLWATAEPDHPTVAAYLAARGVDVAACRSVLGGLPEALRGLDRLTYWDRAIDGDRPVERHTGPAMLARIGRAGDGRGVHRTWISAEGRARGPDGAKLDKRWLGERNAMHGRPVVLADWRALGVSRLIVGEGIETTLAVWSHLAARGEIWAAEAALSRDALCGGGDRLFDGHPSTLYPSAIPDRARPGWLADDAVEEVLILAEGSAKNPTAAERLTRRAAARHAFRSDGSVRRCEYRLPGRRWDRDVDFADLFGAAARGAPA